MTRLNSRVTMPCHGVFCRDVTTADAIKLLEKYRKGKVTLAAALRAFQAPPVTDLGFAQVDTHRALRKGFAEVIYGAGKTGPQIVKIAAAILKREERVLITRLSDDQSRLVKKNFKSAKIHSIARCATIEKKPLVKRAGTVAVVCAGTSDLPVAEEAVVTADIMGNQVERVYDVGVAGLHRLLNKLEVIRAANVVIVVAGMEGALPSVVAGLVSRPVIAVPTSSGYGTHFGGLTPLLSMLNSCGSGVTVVNIDNGFGAGYAASQINALSAGGV
jgi:pyridinium-3,5-biscarboxylic acid mononucleotide synthase